MSLEAVMYDQQQDLFVQNNINNSNNNNNNNNNININGKLDNFVWANLIDLPSSSDQGWHNNYNYPPNYYDTNYNYNYDHNNHASVNYTQWGPTDQNSTSPEVEESGCDGTVKEEVVVVRPKRRRRVKTKKNIQEIENQRMTHIAVERNRRKQMNDYLFTLRSLMPNSFVQRGDQASIIGGAINYVKELEQNLQCLSVTKQGNENCGSNSSTTTTTNLPFGEFFFSPQYYGGSDDRSGGMSHRIEGCDVAADVEVTMVESHVLLKIRAKKGFKQLSKVVNGLQDLGLSILHLNVSKFHGVAFYTFSLKVEDDLSKMSSVDEIATAVYRLLCRIQEEAIY